MVTNLRLNSRQEENEGTREKRKLSAELNNDEDDVDDDNDNEIKKPKIEDETNCLVKQPKIVNLKENPIFDQIKLANCFLRDQSLMKAKTDWESEEEVRQESEDPPQNLTPSLSLSSSQPSPNNDFQQRNSVGKQSVVNSNSKLLDKVTV